MSECTVSDFARNYSEMVISNFPPVHPLLCDNVKTQYGALWKAEVSWARWRPRALPLHNGYSTTTTFRVLEIPVFTVLTFACR